ncbi:MAG: PadR family transcriptional regulator [Acidimicrobiia bacterium]|nr:PadR family transcriptional regulator [Acidimicrobiia bacterium]
MELAVLGVLREGELHGYELRKRLQEVLGPGAKVSFGSLYPALGRLATEGAVREVEPPPDSGVPPETEGPSTPMTGSFTGEVAAFRAAHASKRRPRRGSRNKKVFGITAAGETRLAEMVAEPRVDDRSFSLKMAFCRWCDRETRLGLFERRRSTLLERLSESRGAMGRPRSRLDHYARALLEHDTESTERSIAWLDRLITAERSGTADVVAAPAPIATIPTMTTTNESKGQAE